MPFLRQSTAQTIRFGPCLDVTDGVTEETALTLVQADMRLSKDGGAFAQKSAAGNATHDSDGWYSTSLSMTDTATVGELILNVHQPANMLPVWLRWWVLEEVIYDALFGAAAAGFDANQRVDVGSWLGTAAATPTVAGVPEVDITHVAGAVINALIAGRIDANAQVVGDKTGYTLTGADQATLVNLIWNELIAEARTALSYGQRLRDAVGLDTLTAARVGNLDNPDVLTSSRAVPGDAMALTAAAVDTIWDEDIVAAHGTASTAGLLLRVLGAGISTRANNPTLDALLGVVDAAGRDLPEQVWLEAVRVLTANTNLNDPTAAANAAAVWDEAKAGHVGAGSFGEEVQAHALSSEISALNDISTAEVNIEMLDVMNIDTLPELAQGVPPTNPTDRQATMLIYMALRNRLDIDTGGATDFKEIYNNAGIVIAKKALTDDGTVYSEALMQTGP